MLVLIIILPQISVDYNLERLYQQILIILAPIMSLGLYSIYKIFKYRSFAIALSIFILICYLWSNSGLVSQIISGQDDLIFSNVGNAYDTFYTHNGEIFALQWLAEQNIKPEYISIDLYSSLKANAYTNLNVKQINKLMVPAKLADSKLIYEGQTNMTEGRTFFLFNNNVVSFNYPTVYLSGNKNKIFTDNSGTVYQ
jgi:uncharacterized membrane protein